MSEVVLVASITGIVTLLATIAAQLLTRQREERLEETKHQRVRETESRERRERFVRELWACVLTTQTRLVDQLDRSRLSQAPASANHEASATYAAAQAYAVSLLGPIELRPLVKELYIQTTVVEGFLLLNDPRASERMPVWRAAFEALEQVLSSQDHIL